MVNWCVQSFAELGSTQDTLKELADHGAPEGTAIQALSQKNGRGRHGREWQSPLGNLYLSVLLRPMCSANKAGQISLFTALALANAMKDVLAADTVALVKWPNDILIEGRKCAGILLDTVLSPQGEIQQVIIGMGVNMTSAPAGIGTFLNEHCVKKPDLTIFREKLLAQLSFYYDMWQQEGFATIREEWLSMTYAPGAIVSVKLGEMMQRGAFAGIDENGNLLLRGDEGNMRVISAGDVYFSES